MDFALNDAVNSPSFAIELMKRGKGGLRLWRKRYFVLRENFIYYHRSKTLDDLLNPLGRIAVQDIDRVERLPPPQSQQQPPQELYFNLHTRTADKRVYLLWCGDVDRANDFIETIHTAKSFATHQSDYLPPASTLSLASLPLPTPPSSGGRLPLAAAAGSDGERRARKKKTSHILLESSDFVIEAVDSETGEVQTIYEGGVGGGGHVDLDEFDEEEEEDGDNDGSGSAAAAAADAVYYTPHTLGSGSADPADVDLDDEAYREAGDADASTASPSAAHLQHQCLSEAQRRNYGFSESLALDCLRRWWSDDDDDDGGGGGGGEGGEQRDWLSPATLEDAVLCVYVTIARLCDVSLRRAAGHTPLALALSAEVTDTLAAARDYATRFADATAAVSPAAAAARLAALRVRLQRTRDADGAAAAVAFKHALDAVRAAGTPTRQILSRTPAGGAAAAAAPPFDFRCVPHAAANRSSLLRCFVVLLAEVRERVAALLSGIGGGGGGSGSVSGVVPLYMEAAQCVLLVDHVADTLLRAEFALPETAMPQRLWCMLVDSEKFKMDESFGRSGGGGGGGGADAAAAIRRNPYRAYELNDAESGAVVITLPLASADVRMRVKRLLEASFLFQQLKLENKRCGLYQYFVRDALEARYDALSRAFREQQERDELAAPYYRVLREASFKLFERWKRLPQSLLEMPTLEAYVADRESVATNNNAYTRAAHEHVYYITLLLRNSMALKRIAALFSRRSYKVLLDQCLSLAAKLETEFLPHLV